MKEHLKVILSQVTGSSININLIFKSSSPHLVLIRGQELHILHLLYMSWREVDTHAETRQKESVSKVR